MSQFSYLFPKHAQRLISRTVAQTQLMSKHNLACRYKYRSGPRNFKESVPMISPITRSFIGLPSTRTLSVSCRCNDSNTKDYIKTRPNPGDKDFEGGDLIKVSLRQKRMLVLSKFYKSVEDVPDYVSLSRVNKATSLFRIKANIATMVLFLLASYGVIKVGQKFRSESIARSQQESDDYHDMMDMFDAEIEKAEEEKRRQNAQK